MIEPWFNPNTAGFIPGVAIGVVGAVLGVLTGIMAPRGKGRALLLTLYVAAIVASVALLVLGAIGLVRGQPYGVWYGMGLAGVIGTAVFGSLFFVVRRRYLDAESRRMGAADLS